MERAIPFEVGEYYHVYNRGVDKAVIFRDEHDWKRFVSILYVYNSKKSFAYRGVKLQPLEFERGESIVDLIAYSLMPNHFHLLVREKQQGGISKYMSKVLTSYSMYMNEKYTRSGPLMCRPFRSKHIETDEYLRWVLAYIHLNPVHSSGKARPGSELRNALRKYKHSSFHDYYLGKRKESTIVSPNALPFSANEIGTDAHLVSCLNQANNNDFFAKANTFLAQT